MTSVTAEAQIARTTPSLVGTADRLAAEILDRPLRRQHGARHLVPPLQARIQRDASPGVIGPTAKELESPKDTTHRPRVGTDEPSANGSKIPGWDFVVEAGVEPGRRSGVGFRHVEPVGLASPGIMTTSLRVEAADRLVVEVEANSLTGRGCVLEAVIVPLERIGTVEPLIAETSDVLRVSLGIPAGHVGSSSRLESIELPDRWLERARGVAILHLDVSADLGTHERTVAELLGAWSDGKEGAVRMLDLTEVRKRVLANR